MNLAYPSYDLRVREGRIPCRALLLPAGKQGSHEPIVEGGKR